MPEIVRTVTLIFDGEEEQARFYAAKERVPNPDPWIQNGQENAERISVPRIMAGQWGVTDGQIEARIAAQVAVVRKVRRKAEMTADEALLYAISYRSRSRLAKDEFLAALGALDKATTALNHLAAGMEAATEALALAAALTPPSLAPAAQPHLLSLAKTRALRPEDFGALPAGRKI